MHLSMEHHPRATFPWRIRMVDHPSTPVELRSEPERVVNRAYVALDCITRQQRIGGHDYWTHATPHGLIDPLSEVYGHVATSWARLGKGKGPIDRWIEENVPEGCAFREVDVKARGLGDLSPWYRWRLARRADYVAFVFVHR